MISFEWPWMILVLPLPLIFILNYRNDFPEQGTALRVPSLDCFYTEKNGVSSKRYTWWKYMPAFIAWTLLVMAGMKPEWLSDTLEYPVSGRDLMLAVDLSGSMQEQDFTIQGKSVNRLTATKSVASDFIDRRVGDRIGLILFGERAYLQAPLTLDRKTVGILLEESAIGLAGISTAIGDAIGLAIMHMRKYENSNQVLILLTDGANSSGSDPLKAASMAAAEGLKIYTIGVGKDKKLNDITLGAKTKTSTSELNEEALKTIAKMTGGQYFRARNIQELSRIYVVIDELEPIERDENSLRPRKALFYIPLSLAFIIASLLVIYKIYIRAL